MNKEIKPFNLLNGLQRIVADKEKKFNSFHYEVSIWIVAC